ncbi:hypothetical protein [Candidatus Palauibacter sp.]|uniref:hypothetical protein n=1 Tax=Candidatus Palauibacter sp. TaxID=3101350 RepID=UPI003AF27233
MSNRLNPRRRGCPVASLFVIGLAALASYPAALEAQAERIDSPFRWREKGFRVGLFGGYHAANRGRLEFAQGPTSVAGAKMRVRASSPLSLELGATYGAASRWTLDVSGEGGPAIVDTVAAGWLRADAGAQIGLTGARTWNGIHPYGMIGGGFVFGINEGASEALADQALEPFRYDISTAPHIYVGLGFEIFPSEKIGIGFEIRDYLVRVAAPDGYLFPATLDLFEASGAPAPEGTVWGHNPEFGISIWYYF